LPVEWWCVVVEAPSDPLRRCVSKDSPLGEVLLGHAAGDVIEALSAEASWPVLIVAVEPELRSKSSR
jgi:transcription elongation GreA/GreB family factor